MFLTNVDFLIIITAITSVALAFAYVYLAMNKVFKREQILSQEESQMRNKSVHLLEHAQEKAMYIVESAAQKSKQILEHTEVLKQNLDKEAVATFHDSIKNYGDVMAKELDEIKKSYRLKVEEMKNQYLAESKTIFSAFNEEGKRSILDMKKMLGEEKLTSASYLKEKVDAEWEMARKQIEVYKQEQLKKMEEAIRDHVKKISVNVLGKNISLEDQERLVLEALEEAKKEHIFTF